MVPTSVVNHDEYFWQPVAMAQQKPQPPPLSLSPTAPPGTVPGEKSETYDTARLPNHSKPNAAQERVLTLLRPGRIC